MDGLYPPEMGPRRSSETDASAALEVRALARELVFRRIMIVILVVVVAASLTVNTVTVIAIRGQQVSRAPLTDRIFDCTTIGGTCYERGQAQLKATISQLNQYGVVIAACASGDKAKAYESVVSCAVAQIKKLPQIPIPQDAGH